MSLISSILSLFAPSSAFGLSQESQRSLSPEMIPRKLRTVFTGAAVILGGICTLNFASFLTIQTLRLTAEAKRVIHFSLGVYILSKLNLYVATERRPVNSDPVL